MRYGVLRRCHAVIPVSYTHLDVYKRQDGINTKKLVVNPDEAANIRLMFEMYAPVSYTHLDVYKRQGLSSAVRYVRKRFAATCSVSALDVLK